MADLNKIAFGQVETVVESRLNFKPDLAIADGICMANIVSVELVEHDVPKANADGVPSTWEFAGLKTYSLDITYKQINPNAKDASERFLVQKESIVSAKMSNGDSLEVKTWNSLIMNTFNRLQHVVNALDKGGILPKSKNIGDVNISFDDSAEMRISKMKKVFEHFYLQLTGNPAFPKADYVPVKPRYEGVDLWLKVIADVKTNKFYKVPDYVQKGFVEVMKAGAASILELAPNDSIVLVKGKADTKTKDANYKDVDAEPATTAPKSAAEILAGLRK